MQMHRRRCRRHLRSERERHWVYDPAQSAESSEWLETHCPGCHPVRIFFKLIRYTAHPSPETLCSCDINIDLSSLLLIWSNQWCTAWSRRIEQWTGTPMETQVNNYSASLLNHSTTDKVNMYYLDLICATVSIVPVPVVSYPVHHANHANVQVSAVATVPSCTLKSIVISMTLNWFVKILSAYLDDVKRI